MSVPEVALSMLTLVPGGMGGSETYARQLTRQLATTGEVTATAYIPANAAGFSAGIPERLSIQANGGPSTSQRLAVAARLMFNARSVRRDMASADVIHYPFTVPLPRPAGTPFVQTLHDVQHLDMPQLFGRAELAYRRHWYEGAAARANMVVTVSEFARSRMVELLGLRPERVAVAHLGVDLDRFKPNPGPREEFALYPARAWPHKNHETLIQGMRLVRLERPEMRLVLTGAALDTLGELPDWVDRRGLVSPEELRDLYRRAAVLAFPSLYEGFGLPPLEAMASGCPVAASSSGSIPEVCGAAAVLFDAADPGAICEGILTALRRAPELYSAGIEQASRFDWERCRDAHVSAYLEVA